MNGLLEDFIATRDSLLEGAMAMDEEMEQLRAQCEAAQAESAQDRSSEVEALQKQIKQEG